jgi:hypothetical protein
MMVVFIQRTYIYLYFTFVVNYKASLIKYTNLA